MAVGAGTAFTDDHITFVAALVATVVGVAALIAWIDHRIDKAVNKHAAEEERLAQVRHVEVLHEIKHLKEVFNLEQGNGYHTIGNGKT